MQAAFSFFGSEVPGIVSALHSWAYRWAELQRDYRRLARLLMLLGYGATYTDVGPVLTSSHDAERSQGTTARVDPNASPFPRETVIRN